MSLKTPGPEASYSETEPSKLSGAHFTARRETVLSHGVKRREARPGSLEPTAGSLELPEAPISLN